MSGSDCTEAVGFMVNFFKGEAGNGLCFSFGERLSSVSLVSLKSLLNEYNYNTKVQR